MKCTNLPLMLTSMTSASEILNPCALVRISGVTQALGVNTHLGAQLRSLREPDLTSLESNRSKDLIHGLWTGLQ